MEPYGNWDLDTRVWPTASLCTTVREDLINSDFGGMMHSGERVPSIGVLAAPTMLPSTSEGVLSVELLSAGSVRESLTPPYSIKTVSLLSASPTGQEPSPPLRLATSKVAEEFLSSMTRMLLDGQVSRGSWLDWAGIGPYAQPGPQSGARTLQMPSTPLALDAGMLPPLLTVETIQGSTWQYGGEYDVMIGPAPSSGLTVDHILKAAESLGYERVESPKTKPQKFRFVDEILKEKRRVV